MGRREQRRPVHLVLYAHALGLHELRLRREKSGRFIEVLPAGAAFLRAWAAEQVHAREPAVFAVAARFLAAAPHRMANQSPTAASLVKGKSAFFAAGCGDLR